MSDFAPRCDSNEFRKQYCYQSMTDAVLRKYEETLRALFTRCVVCDLGE
jgi:hypothetical protein